MFKYFLNTVKVGLYLELSDDKVDNLARRTASGGELPFEFYGIAFLVSQLRSLNCRISECLMNLPWPYIRNLPAFFYRIYLPSITNMSSITNSNHDPLALSPVKSSLNSTNRYENELFSDSLNSNSIDVITPMNSCEPNIWTAPVIGPCSQVCDNIS